MQPSSRRQQIDTRAGYDLWSDSYDDTPNPVVAMDERHTFALLDPRAGEQVLDLGCGTGRYLTKLRVAGTAHSVGVDFSLGMLRAARRRVSVGHLVCADLQRALPFAGRTFDAMLCALVGEHLEQLHTTLRESFRALRPGGRLVFTVYHPDLAAAGKEANFTRGGIEYRLGAVRYRTEDYLDRLTDAGFSSPGRRRTRAQPRQDLLRGLHP